MGEAENPQQYAVFSFSSAVHFLTFFSPIKMIHNPAHMLVSSTAEDPQWFIGFKNKKAILRCKRRWLAEAYLIPSPPKQRNRMWCRSKISKHSSSFAMWKIRGEYRARYWAVSPLIYLKGFFFSYYKVRIDAAIMNHPKSANLTSFYISNR